MTVNQTYRTFRTVVSAVHFGCCFTKVAAVGQNVTAYSVSRLKARATYFFRFRALRAGLASDVSNISVVTTPA